MITKFYSMLGIGKKAGYVVTGETGCMQSIKKGKSMLVIVAADASDNTKDRLISLCKSRNVEFFVIGEKEQLGYALGKNLTSILCITDLKFSQAIKKIIESI